MKRIGLALGDGAARGLAHIGVIEALEELGARPDYIAGTSIGALVGGWYAAKGDIVSIEKAVRGVSPSRVLGVRSISPRRVGAIFNTAKLRDWLRTVTGDPLIEELEIPFAAVATNVVSGRREVVRNGKLVDAILASSAVPGIFPPVKIGGSLLLDGGLTEPVPYRTVREMGAEAVVGVDLASDVVLKGGEYFVSRGYWKPWQVYNILYNALNIFGHQLAEAQRGEGDILLAPRVGHISPIHFHRVDEAVAAGREAVLSRREEIMSKIA